MRIFPAEAQFRSVIRRCSIIPSLTCKLNRSLDTAVRTMQYDWAQLSVTPTLLDPDALPISYEPEEEGSQA
jgi:hypothetical protein